MQTIDLPADGARPAGSRAPRQRLYEPRPKSLSAPRS